jgi:hypothetical protein
MTVSLAADGTIVLEGICSDEDAEPLLQYLSATPAANVDWRNCVGVHTTVVQVLMAAQPKILGPPGSHFLSNDLGPALTRNALKAAG